MDVFPLTKRQKTFNISDDDDSIWPDLPFSLAEEENHAIFKWSGLLNETASSNESQKSKKKSAQEEALEAASKSQGELAQLISLTNLLQKHQHMVLSNCTRPPGLEPIGLALPASQMIQMRREQYKSMRDIIAQGQSAMQDITIKRQQSCIQLLKLGQYWRLAVLNSKESASPVVFSGRDTVAIDCSYCDISTPSTTKPIPASSSRHNSHTSSTSLALGKMRPALVPLVFSGSGCPSLGVGASLICKTICCNLVHAPTGQSLAVVSLWDSISSKTAAQSPGPGGILDDIHRYCQKRQHQSMCQLMLACIQNDASILSNNSATPGACRWIVAPPLKSRGTLHGDTVLLGVEALTSSLDVASVNRAAVVFALSENLQLMISMQPIEITDSAHLPLNPLARGIARALLGVQRRLAKAIHGLTAQPAKAATVERPESSYIELLVDGVKEIITSQQKEL